MMEHPLAQRLLAGIEQLGLVLSEAQQQQLLLYLDLLHKWNKVFNLTAVRDPLQMVSKHLLDSLAVQPFIQGQRVLDVGTGAGLPGIPLAVMMPTHEFVLLDSNHKKTRFLVEAKYQLDLDNITIVHGRIEGYKPDDIFTDIICRAFADIGAWLHDVQKLGANNAIFWAMKGKYPQQELKMLPSRFRLSRCIGLDIPFLEEERHLLCLQQSLC